MLCFNFRYYYLFYNNLNFSSIAFKTFFFFFFLHFTINLLTQEYNIIFIITYLIPIIYGIRFNFTDYDFSFKQNYFLLT